MLANLLLVLIGIDGNEANVNNRVGSNIYAFEILRGIKNLDKEDKFEIYLREKPLPDLPKEDNKWKYKVFGPKKFWTQFALPLRLFLQSKKPDVFFTPGHYAPRFCPVPSVISILDTSYLLFPNYFKKRDLIQLKLWTSYSINNAKKIITISNSTKKDIVKYYKINRDKITVIYPGYDEDRFNQNLSSVKTSGILEKYKINKPFILFVGTIQPRKNLIRLIDAYKNISKKNKDINLVIAGKMGWLYDRIVDEVNKNNSNIKLVGYVEDKDLPFLYKEARCFVLPSLYEGFGIPAVEAMAVGCPVIVSNVSSLPEIVEDAGIAIDPIDTKSIKEGIERALNLKEEEKNILIAKGLQRAKLFSWEKCAEDTLKILKEVVNENNN